MNKQVTYLYTSNFVSPILHLFMQQPACFFCAYEDDGLSQLLTVWEDHLTQHRYLLRGTGATAVT